MPTALELTLEVVCLLLWLAFIAAVAAGLESASAAAGLV